MPEIPIPARCADRPIVSGLVVPYITLEIDGKTMWGETRGKYVTECIVERRCQLDGQPLGEKFVFLLTQRHLDEKFTREPALHPECAAYAQRACPMIAGRMAHYSWVRREHTGKKCEVPGCGCAGWITQKADNRGRPAEPWFAAWVTDYTIAIADAAYGLVNGNVNGCVLTTPPLKVRPIVPAGAAP